MNLVVLAQLRFLRQSGFAVISALLGMTLGVGSVVGVHLLSERVEQEISSNSQPLGAVDLYLHKTGLLERHYFELRKRWRAGEFPTVKNLFPIVEGKVRFAGRSYQLVGTDPLALPFTTGAADDADRSSERALSAVSQSYLTRDSLLAPDELIQTLRTAHSAAELDALTMELNGLDVEVLGPSGRRGTLIADLPSAARVLGLEGRLSRIAVQLHPATDRGVVLSEVRRWIGSLFPGVLPATAPRVLVGMDESWQQVALADALPTLRLTRSILFNIAALSLLSLVVAWLLTYQVAQHAIGRRQAMFTRLLSVGVDRRRLNKLALLEGCGAGLLAVLLGLLLGRALADGLFTAALGSAPDPPLNIDGWVLGKAVVSGVGVGVISYLLALRENRRQTTADSSGHAELINFGLPHKLLSVVLLLGFLWGALDARSGLAGAFLTILVSALAAFAYLPVLMSALWRSTTNDRSTVDHRLNSRAQPKAPPRRKGLSPLRLLPIRQLLVGRELRLGISALTLALATALGIAVMVDSFRAAFVDLLDRRLVDDVALEISGVNGLSQLEALLQIQGLGQGRHKSTIPAPATAVFLRGSKPILCAGVAGSLEYASDDEELALRFGARTKLAVGELLISESFAYFNDIQRDDRVTLQGERGVHEYRVVAVFADFGETQPRVVLRRGDAARLVDVSDYTQALIQSSDPALLKMELTKAGVEFSDPAETKQQALAVFQQTFGITRALTSLALIVALVALINALSAQALALAPAENLLRVLGVTPSSARWLRLRRASIAGGLAVGLALPLGLLMAWLLCNLVNPRAFGWQFPLLITPMAVLWPLGGGLLAALFSALIVWHPRAADPVSNP